MTQYVDAERQSGISLAATDSDVIISSLARDVTHARIDLVHFALMYYFASGDPRAGVPMWVGDLVRLASDACEPSRPDHVRLAGNALDRALHDFAAIVDARFLHTGSHDRDRIFQALATDHVVNRSMNSSGALLG